MDPREANLIGEEITEQEILREIQSLPGEDDLPYDDGEPMETAYHRDQMNILIESLRYHWQDQRRYYVGGNMFLYYDPYLRGKFRGPDFFLVLDVENRARKSWVVWQEGMRFPDLIIELLSESTREIDLGEKKQLYERVFKTSEYYVYDPMSQEFRGYRLVDMHYQGLEPDEERKIYCKVTGLYLIVKDEWLRWMTPGGMILPTPFEAAMQEKLRAEAAQRQAEQERQRAEQERQRAEQEKQRAEQAERLLQEYRRRYGDLQ